VIFEWNAAKAKSNRQKHGVSFEEAATVFLDPLALTFSDPDHSALEEREITIGRTTDQRIVLVSHCWRDDHMRIVSARKATRKERVQYEEGIDQETK
jgi:hypothetical protein